MMLATANSKGGVGKSTIAVHLAVWLRDHGIDVVLVDCDPQRSSSEWVAEACPAVRSVWLNKADDVFNELPKLRRTCDCVIVDGPAGLDEISRAILVYADGVIVPCKAGTLEARALLRATKAIRQVQELPGREGLPEPIIVLTMVGERFILTREMREAAESLGFPVAKSILRQRQAYALAPGKGTVLWRMGSRARDAAIEMDEFFRELLPGMDSHRGRTVSRLCVAEPSDMRPNTIPVQGTLANG